ncbi:MAG: O-antigen ligase family protein [Desulfobacterales bacterium]|nr:O-antigen ligase family protein [Desulfobacterales bacterium]
MATAYTPTALFWGMTALLLFLVSFVNIEFGLYVLILSMLLSPEFGAGATQGGTLGRGVTLRYEDFLLVIIGASWFAKNAVHKELGLFLRTPLNRGIFLYAVACVLSTGFGIMTGRVSPGTGSLFVLKYFEYFIIYFMMVNHVESASQVKRFVFLLFFTCFVVSILGIMQIPEGGRVSAPFEGEAGEPNTFGGYLAFMAMIAAGVFTQVRDLKIRQALAVLLVFIIPPLLFTQSRASYLAVVVSVLALGFMMEKRAIIVGVMIVGLLLSPLFMPRAVIDRVLYTIKQPLSRGQISVAGVRLDTSTSARLVSWQQALTDWTRKPFFGYGVTGYKFMDAQFPRVLTETGILGLAAFLYLLFSVWKMAVNNLRVLTTPYYRGLTIGFIAGFVGLIVHSVGANTFIIVRIMEPFWFFAGIIFVLPQLEKAELLAQASAPVATSAAPIPMRR